MCCWKNSIRPEETDSGHTRDDWSFPTSLFGWNRQRPSNIHVTSSLSRFYTILSSWFTIFRVLSKFLSPNYMNLTLRRRFTFLAKSVLITRTTDGMLKDEIDIYVPVNSLLRQGHIKGLARGHTKIKSWSLVVSDAQKVNNILYSFNKMVKILMQHTEIEQNRERLIAKIQHC